MEGIGKGFAFAVFEVFMQHLIAANVVVQTGVMPSKYKLGSTCTCAHHT